MRKSSLITSSNEERSGHERPFRPSEDEAILVTTWFICIKIQLDAPMQSNRSLVVVHLYYSIFKDLLGTKKPKLFLRHKKTFEQTL